MGEGSITDNVNEVRIDNYIQDIQKCTYFEHLRTTMLAIGESSCIQFMPAEGDLSISSKSTSKELRLPSNHLKDLSLTNPSSIFLVLLASPISFQFTIFFS